MYAKTQRSIVAKKLGVTHAEAERVIQAVGELIIEALLDDGNITLANLIKLKLRRTQPRTMMNNLTGMRIEVPGKTKIVCSVVKPTDEMFK